MEVRLGLLQWVQFSESGKRCHFFQAINPDMEVLKENQKLSASKAYSFFNA